MMTTAPQVAWAICNSLWQGAAIAAAAWLALRIARRASAAVRYHVWSFVLVAAIVLPFINAGMPQRVLVIAQPHPAVPALAAVARVEARLPALRPTAGVAHPPRTTNDAPPPRPTTRASSVERRAARSSIGPRSSLPSSMAPTSIATSISTEARTVGAGLGASAVAIGQTAQPALPFGFAAWLAVAALLFARLGWGLSRLRTIKRGLEPLEGPAIEAMCRASGRCVRVAMSGEVGSPCVIGYLHPVVALPSSLVASLDAADLRRVLAHELAHVRRYDDWANLVQQCVRAALFFNPVVHVACRALDVSREIACDDLVAAGHADRIEYAKCLTEIARRGAYVEHLVPAAGFFPDRRQIVVRIEQLLDRDHSGSARVGAIPAATAIVVVIAIAALAAHQLPALAIASPPSSPFSGVQGASARAAAVARQRAGAERELAAASSPENAELASSVAPTDKEPRSAPIAAARAVAAASLRARAVVTGARMAQTMASAMAPRTSEMTAIAAQVRRAAAASAAASPEDDFLDALDEAGYTHLSVDDLIAIRNSGVSGPYLRALKRAGILPMPVKTLIALSNSGVTASTIAAMKAAGYTGLDAGDLIALQNAGVTPAFVLSAKDSLRPAPSMRDLIALANAGVTSTYIDALAKSGYSRLSPASIVKLQNAGVSSNYLVDMAKLGHAGMSVDSLVALAIAGVSPQYIRGLAELGYSSVSTDDLIRMMNAGVTPDLIKRLRAHGLSDGLSVDELIKLAENGF